MRPALKTIFLAMMQLLAGFAGNAIYSDSKSSFSRPTVIGSLVFIVLFTAYYYREEQRREILKASLFSDLIKEILPAYTAQAKARLKNGESLKTVLKDLVDADEIVKRLNK